MPSSAALCSGTSADRARSSRPVSSAARTPSPVKPAASEHLGAARRLSRLIERGRAIRPAATRVHRATLLTRAGASKTPESAGRISGRLHKGGNHGEATGTSSRRGVLGRGLMLAAGALGIGAARRAEAARAAAREPRDGARAVRPELPPARPVHRAGQVPVKGDRHSAYGELLGRPNGKVVGHFTAAHLTHDSPFAAARRPRDPHLHPEGRDDPRSGHGGPRRRRALRHPRRDRPNAGARGSYVARQAHASSAATARPSSI